MWPRFYRLTVTPERISISVAALLTLVFNNIFFHSIWALGGWSLSLPLLALLFLVNVVICGVFSISKLQKIWLCSLLLIASSSQYFMQQYGIIIDKGMLINALETDSHEVAGLLSLSMLPYFALYFVLPAVAIVWVKPQQTTTKSAVIRYSMLLLIALSLIALLLQSQYQNYAGVFRQHRYLKHQAVPLNAIAATLGLVKSKVASGPPVEFQRYALDAKVTPRANNSAAKPKLIIMVLGETVRADHLGINGYLRNTTPKLTQRKLINFGAVDSCGTATAISVPCMFSYLNRANYDDTLAKNSDNLLDVLQRAGVNVFWRNNNSGCKTMCNRINNDHSFSHFSPTPCQEGTCADIALLYNLKQQLTALPVDDNSIFMVLHQQGNHGPEYYKRSEAQHKLFLPECTSNLLSQCQPQHIINAYDNAIVATDTLLDATITLLDELSTSFDTAMLYVSDHGESLGENGVYLHGLPYWLAPAAQTQVPMLMWLSDGFTKQKGLNTACLQQQTALSHDYLFDSILTMFEITSQSKRRELDFINGCIS
ncbi:hypothetical protein VT06_02320 [Arsukibacterium sp. MJ3]|nr:hypothetical protein VT06_02320 [Arsukibacterium sp. MJ3]